MFICPPSAHLFDFLRINPIFSALSVKIKCLFCHKKQKTMSKKPVTIPQVDEDVYTALKNKAAEQKQSISELVNEIMLSYVEGNENSEELTNLQLANKHLSEELAALNDITKQLTENYTKLQEKLEATENEKDKLAKQLSTLQMENAKAKEVITELTEAKQKWEDHYNEAKNANETLTAMKANTVQVELSELEFALIQYVAEKESKRSGKDVTPALLLKTMFAEYCIKGETWFFPFPKRSEIAEIKSKLTKEE